MSNAAKVLEEVNDLKPNPFADRLGDFLESIELRIKSELFNEESPVYDPSSLSLGKPDDSIYYLYLFGIIDFLNGEYGRYENTFSQFEKAWNKLASQLAEIRKNQKRRITLW